VLTDSKSYTALENGWIFRIRPPKNPATAKILVLIHGFTGDENSMWVFGRPLDENYLLVAPRAIHRASTFGYSWAQEEGLLHIDSLQPAVIPLLERIQKTALSLQVNPELPISIMGFSQGAALAYTISILRPSMVSYIAALSGFLPDGAERYLTQTALPGKHFFIAHGTEDTTVPVDKARTAVHFIREAGADVTYCEGHVGHKIDVNCFSKLKDFFSLD
jgi:phospholipase/carboxylesterase